MFVIKSGLFPEGVHRSTHFDVYSLSLHQDLLHGGAEGLYESKVY